MDQDSDVMREFEDFLDKLEERKERPRKEYKDRWVKPLVNPGLTEQEHQKRITSLRLVKS